MQEMAKWAFISHPAVVRSHLLMLPFQIYRVLPRFGCQLREYRAPLSSRDESQDRARLRIAHI